MNPLLTVGPFVVEEVETFPPDPNQEAHGSITLRAASPGLVDREPIRVAMTYSQAKAFLGTIYDQPARRMMLTFAEEESEGERQEDKDRSEAMTRRAAEALIVQAQIAAIEAVIERISEDAGRNSPKAICRTLLRGLRKGTASDGVREHLLRIPQLAKRLHLRLGMVFYRES